MITELLYNVTNSNHKIGTHNIKICDNKLQAMLFMENYEEETLLEFSKRDYRPHKIFLRKRNVEKEDFCYTIFNNTQIDINLNGKTKQIWFNGICYDNIQLLTHLPLIYEKIQNGFGKIKNINLFVPFAFEILHVVVYDTSLGNNEICFKIEHPVRAELFYDKISFTLLRYTSKKINYQLFNKKYSWGE